ncbi:MAG: HAD family hydrolase [Sciscionella sp.]
MSSDAGGVDWVVLDYGEVLCEPTTALPSLARIAGVDPRSFEAAYWGHRESYDRGLPDDEYWRLVGRSVGVELGETTRAALTVTDIAGWLHTRPECLRLLESLAAGRTRLALLSNASRTFATAVRREPWATAFTELMFSGEQEMAKPDAAIFAALLDRLGAPPARCFFVDDRQSNVDGARAAGLLAWRFTGVEPLRTQLSTLGALPT